jgi:type II secretory pathway pseudopilin PulG
MKKKSKKRKFFSGFTPAPKCYRSRSIKSPNKFMVRGFTILEILAIVAVMGIMLAVTMVSLTETSSEAKLISAQREVASAIKTAKSYALQGKTNASAGALPKYWGVKFTNTSTYRIFYTNLIGGSEWNEETFQLKNGVVLSDPLPADTAKVYFGVPNGGATGSINLPFSYSLELGTLPEKTITIDSGGVVTEN